MLSNLKFDEDYKVLNDVPLCKDGVKVMLGAGTGLGHGFMTKNSTSKYHEVCASEGGHMSFTPNNDTEWQLANFLKKKLKQDHISIEDCCRGPVIKLICEFIADQ